MDKIKCSMFIFAFSVFGLAQSPAPAGFNPVDANTRLYLTATIGTKGDSVLYNQASVAPDSVVQTTASARPMLVGDSVYTFDGGDWLYSLQAFGEFPASSAITLEFWGKLSGAGSVTGARQDGFDYWSFGVSSNYASFAFVEKDAPGTSIIARTPGTPIAYGVEYYVVAVLPASRDTAYFYIDGALVAGTLFDSKVNPTGSINADGAGVAFGARSSIGTSKLPNLSTLRMVAIHSTERDATWISNHYQYLQGNIATAQQQQATTKWLGFGSWLGW